MEFVEGVSDIKTYLVEVLKSEHIKNLDSIENIGEFKVINYNTNYTENQKRDDFKYINYIPIQLYNPKTEEILTVLQQSVSKNTFKIRKSQTLIEFDKNFNEYLHLFKGPERDSLMKYKAIEFSNDNKDVVSKGNYNIPNSVSLHAYLQEYLGDKELLDKKLHDINKTDISKLVNVNDVMLKNLLSIVLFNKSSRNKMLRQVEYYYYYKDYETARKLAENIAIIFEWFVNNEEPIETKLSELTVEDLEDEEEIELAENKNANVKKGIAKELLTFKKVIEKCNQNLTNKCTE